VLIERDRFCDGYVRGAGRVLTMSRAEELHAPSMSEGPGGHVAHGSGTSVRPSPAAPIVTIGAPGRQ